MALKNRKTRKYRGSRTCGGGSAKNRRGAGHRGGRGNAGIKKHYKSWYLAKDPSALVKKGDGRPRILARLPRAVNIGTLEERLESLLSQGIAKEVDGKIHIDLAEAGYDRLLGAGVVRRPWVIKAGAASRTAVEKVSAAGGEVVTEGGTDLGAE